MQSKSISFQIVYLFSDVTAHRLYYFIVKSSKFLCSLFVFRFDLDGAMLMGLYLDLMIRLIENPRTVLISKSKQKYQIPRTD